MRSASVLEVARPALWDELDHLIPLDAHTVEVLDPLRRAMAPSFDEALPELRRRGVPVLVRYARRGAAEAIASRHDVAARVDALPERIRRVLYRVQRHARERVVIGSHVWDPELEAEAVHALHGAGLIESLGDDAAPRHGRYQLHEDLPAPVLPLYDFAEAIMPETDDLVERSAGPVALLHDLASLAAALLHHPPRRTHAGALEKPALRRLGDRLGSPELSRGDPLEAAPRWGRALAALEALRAVEMDPIARVLHVEPGLEALLEGTTAEAVDRLLHRMVEPDLQAAIPAVRAALAQAGDEAVDELIFLELLEAQDREVVFAPWFRDGAWIYPGGSERERLPWTAAAFDAVEGRMLRELLRIVHRLGLIRRAPGVFAPTADGRLWATGTDPAAPPVWLGSDLEMLVPPNAVTPWERYQLERLGRCVSRDVVDRYRLEREGLEAWLSTHDLDQALDLLRRRCAGVPEPVRETLVDWARSASRFTLTRGVLLDDAPGVRAPLEGSTP